MIGAIPERRTMKARWARLSLDAKREIIAAWSAEMWARYDRGEIRTPGQLHEQQWNFVDAELTRRGL